jgi:ribosomal protein L3 glutamine methyltransferase
MLLSGLTSTQACLQKMTEAFEAAELFFGHGTDNAWDEACWLLETLARRQGLPALQLDTELPESLRLATETLAEARLTTRKPLAYLLNEAWFCGLPFYVDERVLVPRSPFAELVDKHFKPLLKTSPHRILDLCTGGGCIGIACALAFPEADVVLADLSPEALAVARINVEKHGLSNRISLVESDLFTAVQGQFDLIVSNPPYVGSEEYAELPQEYLNEPQLGLLTGNDGLEIPLRILQQAPSFLTANGLLFLETGATWPLLDEARPELPFWWLDFELGGEGICALTKEQLLGSKV